MLNRLKKNFKFITIIGSSLSESHVYNVKITNEFPNVSNHLF